MLDRRSPPPRPGSSPTCVRPHSAGGLDRLKRRVIFPLHHHHARQHFDPGRCRARTVSASPHFPSRIGSRASCTALSPHTFTLAAQFPSRFRLQRPRAHADLRHPRNPRITPEPTPVTEYHAAARTLHQSPSLPFRTQSPQLPYAVIPENDEPRMSTQQKAPAASSSHASCGSERIPVTVYQSSSAASRAVAAEIAALIRARPRRGRRPCSASRPAQHPRASTTSSCACTSKKDCRSGTS